MPKIAEADRGRATAPRVVMLCADDWRYHTRIVREAESLARRGLDVHVVALSDRTPREEAVDGVTYHSVRPTSGRIATILVPTLRAHLRFIGVHAVASLRKRRLTWAARSYRRLLVYVVAAPFAGALLALASGAWLLGKRRSGGAQPNRESLPTRVLRGSLTGLVYLNDYAIHCTTPIVELAPDVVHAHDLVTASAAAAAAHRASCRWIYDAHELETHTNYAWMSPATRRAVAFYEPLVVQSADEVVTVSDSIAGWLKDHYGIARPRVILNAPSAVTESQTPAAERNIRSDLGVPNEVPLVVYVGSVTVDRGLELCVEALVELPGVHFATVGPRRAETERAMRTIAARAGVATRVHLADPVRASEVCSYISSADASVVAIQNVCLSYYYCFPNKLLESIFAGLPVAVADLPELRAFVDENDVGVVVDERSPHSIAHGLQEVLAAPDRYRPDGERMRAIASKYAWPAQEQRLWELYDRLLGLPPPGSPVAQAVPT